MKKLILMMCLLGLFTGCKSQNNNDGNDGTIDYKPKDEPTMPEGKLNKLEYNFSGMMIPAFGDFTLQRKEDGKGATLNFRHYNVETSYEVSDTLLDAARRIIEEEKMYAFARSYTLVMNDGERILDGYHWDFYADFDDRYISSSGRHASPEGNGLHRIEKLLSEAAQQCIENDKEKAKE